MLTILTLYKEPKGGNEAQGERSFWSWQEQGAKYLAVMEKAIHKYLPPAQTCCLVDNGRAGWWNKLAMFAPGNSRGLCLYTDLDNVIAKSLELLVSLTPEPIIMADDRLCPGMPNGSIMLFNADAPVLRALWTEYEANPAAIEREFSEDHWPLASDQAFIADRVRKAGYAIPLFQDLLPPGYLLTAKELEAGADWSNTHIVCGQGVPKPHDSTHPFYAEHWK